MRQRENQQLVVVNLPAGSTAGSNTSVLIWDLSSGFTFHTSTPFAIPAAIAAPRAVVSGIVGRTTNNNGNTVNNRAV